VVDHAAVEGVLVKPEPPDVAVSAFGPLLKPSVEGRIETRTAVPLVHVPIVHMPERLGAADELLCVGSAARRAVAEKEAGKLVLLRHGHRVQRMEVPQDVELHLPLLELPLEHLLIELGQLFWEFYP